MSDTNPYASPKTTPRREEAAETLAAQSVTEPIKTGLCGVAVAVLLGGVTNSINGWVSPRYFVTIMGWRDVENVWLAAVLQGMLEGLVFGILFTAVFLVTIGIISRAAYSFPMALPFVLRIGYLSLVFWVVGGALAICWSGTDPLSYKSCFIGVPDETGEMLRYAWVGGSILGLQSGGLVAAITSCVAFYSRWQRLMKEHSTE